MVFSSQEIPWEFGSPGHADKEQFLVVVHDHPWTLPKGDIIGRAIVIQRFEVLADMGAKRIGVVARRFQLIKPAAHCCFFSIAKRGLGEDTKTGFRSKALALAH